MSDLWDGLWQPFYNEIVGATGWVGKLLGGGFSDNLGDQYGQGDPFTGINGSFDPFTGEWTTDPFLTQADLQVESNPVADVFTNAVNGEVVNPFDAPGSSDTSQWLASKGSGTTKILVYPSPLSSSNSDTPNAIRWDSEPIIIYQTPTSSPSPASPPPAQSTVSTVTPPVASDYDPAADRGDLPGILVPPSYPPIDTGPSAPLGAPPLATETASLILSQAEPSVSVGSPTIAPQPQGPELNVLHVPEITIVGRTEEQVAADIQKQLRVDPYELALRAYGPITMHDLEDHLYEAHVLQVPEDPLAQPTQVLDEIAEPNLYGPGFRLRAVYGGEKAVAQLKARGQDEIDQEFAQEALAGAGGLQPGAATAGIGKPFGGAEFDYPALGLQLESSLPSTLEAPTSAANLQHVLSGGTGDRGIGVLHLDVSELTPADINSTVDTIRDMDFQAGMADGLVRTAVSSRSIANRVAGLGRSALSLGPAEAAGHVPDVAGGGSPLGPIMGMQRSVNSSIGGQWSRYAPGFTFDGFSLIDRATGEFLYISQALENEPAPILDFQF